jgi:hypothetical protein
MMLFSVNTAKSTSEDQFQKSLREQLCTPFLLLERTVRQVLATLPTVRTLRVTTLVNRSRTLSHFARALLDVNDGGEANRNSVTASD